jgi:hypothetical protein
MIADNYPPKPGKRGPYEKKSDECHNPARNLLPDLCPEFRPIGKTRLRRRGTTPGIGTRRCGIPEHHRQRFQFGPSLALELEPLANKLEVEAGVSSLSVVTQASGIRMCCSRSHGRSRGKWSLWWAAAQNGFTTAPTAKKRQTRSASKLSRSSCSGLPRGRDSGGTSNRATNTTSGNVSTPSVSP